jgi:cytochrome c oxidase cbb3-type subunit 3
MKAASRLLAALAALIAAIALLHHFWRPRDYAPPPAASSEPAFSVGSIEPGGPRPEAPPPAQYQETAYEISEGHALFRAMNCNGCHANGGGSIGPALMDETWIYGSSPQQIHATILEGRPNGMPAFRGKLTDAQAWQLVAYVRSLALLTGSTVRPAREDHMQSQPPQSIQAPQAPVQEHPP